VRLAIISSDPQSVVAIKAVISPVAGYEVIWVARDGTDGLVRCQQQSPDVILLHSSTSLTEAKTAIEQIIKIHHCRILIVTQNVQCDTGFVSVAMGLGALDAANLPSHPQDHGAVVLLNKLQTIGKLIGKGNFPQRGNTSANAWDRLNYGGSVTKPQLPITLNSERDSGIIGSKVGSNLPQLLVIGSSTGGPQALATVLSKLPRHLPLAVVIVQHVDAQFASGLVDWLHQQTKLSVALAQEGSRPEAGKVFVAGTNDHLLLKPSLTFAYTRDPIDYPYRPSVDVFFKSVATHWPVAGLATLLTGMGRDGGAGMLALRQKGWHTIAQNQASCVVYGMPKAAVELGAAVEVLSLNDIGTSLSKRLWI
jgi:two-component system response regulator WspF